MRVLSSPAVDVPFSFWLPGLHWIVLPVELILRPADLRMALRHEAQHHRQLDTRLTYAYQLLRALFFWNPAVHWLQRSVAELQEFACDEALIAHRKVSAHAYCSCLLRLAESAMQRHGMAICAGMLGSAGGRGVLKERIETLLTPRPTGSGRAPVAIGISSAMFVLMLGTTAAFSATIHDRRIESLQRMQQHEALIVGALAHHGMPAELLAVPLVESGYRNLPPGDNPRHGAGLWIFIEPTAREFGLTVNASIDERLDVARETDAAMRMFSRLHERFGDWGLALLAYNTGARRVEQATHATGSRDVWQIVEQGYENDPDYVARVMAALLIMKNPTALE